MQAVASDAVSTRNKFCGRVCFWGTSLSRVLELARCITQYVFLPFATEANRYTPSFHFCYSPPRPMNVCQACRDTLCGDCCDKLVDSFHECLYCGLDLYKLYPKCLGIHACLSPGKLVYSSRDATANGDLKPLACACGKKHLKSAKGQQFMCARLARKVNLISNFSCFVLAFRPSDGKVKDQLGSLG